MRSQKVGGLEEGRLATILHPSGTLGVLVVTPQVCLQCFIGLKKGGVVSAKAPSLTQITPSAAQPPSPQIHPPPPASVLIYLWWNSSQTSTNDRLHPELNVDVILVLILKAALKVQILHSGL